MASTQETQRPVGAARSSDKPRAKLSTFSKKDSHASTADRDSKQNSKKISIRVTVNEEINLGTPKTIKTSDS